MAKFILRAIVVIVAFVLFSFISLASLESGSRVPLVIFGGALFAIASVAWKAIGKEDKNDEILPKE